MNWYLKAQFDQWSLVEEGEEDMLSETLQDMEKERTRQERISLRENLFSAVAGIIASEAGECPSIDVVYTQIVEWYSSYLKNLGNQEGIDIAKETLEKLRAYPSVSLADCGVPGTIACWGIASGLLGIPMKTFKTFHQSVRFVMLTLVAEHKLTTPYQAKRVEPLLRNLIVNQGKTTEEARVVVEGLL